MRLPLNNYLRASIVLIGGITSALAAVTSYKERCEPDETDGIDPLYLLEEYDGSSDDGRRSPGWGFFASLSPVQTYYVEYNNEQHEGRLEYQL